jgi:hypothetical protein
VLSPRRRESEGVGKGKFFLPRLHTNLGWLEDIPATTTSVSNNDQRANATYEQASSAPLITCPQSVDKEGIRGKPGIPNPRSPRTMTSKDQGASGRSPVMTSRGGLESGPPPPPEAPTRAISLEDKGVRGSGRVTE